MKNIKKIGNEYEKKLLDFLKEKNYWVHLFSYNKDGQPCDVICIKNNIAFLIDVKHCENDVFYFSRVESNQYNCFLYASQCGNDYDNLGFAIYCEKTQDFRWLSFKMLLCFKSVGKVKVSCLKRLDEVL